MVQQEWIDGEKRRPLDDKCSTIWRRREELSIFTNYLPTNPPVALLSLRYLWETEVETATTTTKKNRRSIAPCALCLSRDYLGSQSQSIGPCNHKICDRCIPLLPVTDCPMCPPKFQDLTQEPDKKLLTSHLKSILLRRPAPPPVSATRWPPFDNPNQTLLSLSHPSLCDLSPPTFPCARLTNIPWDVSQEDIRAFLSGCNLASSSECPQPIHIMMNRTTGKTLSDCYVEFATYADLSHAIETRHLQTLKGRLIMIQRSSQHHLLQAVFPQCFHIHQAPQHEPSCPSPFVTREEINSLLVICKSYKLHSSRKCPERPFENIISIVSKCPWHQPHLITTMHRDHIYEMLKLAIEALMHHMGRNYVSIHPSLPERMVRAGLMCPGFTDRQKMTLFHAAGLPCPEHWSLYLKADEPQSTSSSPVLPLTPSHSCSAVTAAQHEKSKELLLCALLRKDSDLLPSNMTARYGEKSPFHRS